jgi:hypothetical protein
MASVKSFLKRDIQLSREGYSYAAEYLAHPGTTIDRFCDLRALPTWVNKLFASIAGGK